MTLMPTVDVHTRSTRAAVRFNAFQVCLLAFGAHVHVRVARAQFDVSAFQCRMGTLASRLGTTNTACCADEHGRPTCTGNGSVPSQCSVSCATTFVPFYKECKTELNGLFDGADGACPPPPRAAVLALG